MPNIFISLLMSEKGARVSSIRRCFRGGVLQYGGGGMVGGEGVASTGTPTGKAAEVRGLWRDGISEQFTCGLFARVVRRGPRSKLFPDAKRCQIITKMPYPDLGD